MQGAVRSPGAGRWHDTTQRRAGSWAAIASATSRAPSAADGGPPAVSGPTPRPASRTATAAAATTSASSERIARLRLIVPSATSGDAAQELGDPAALPLERPDQRGHHPRVELRAGRALELVDGLVVGAAGAEDAVVGEGAVRVRGGHDPGLERDRLARQAVRVAMAVPALVVVADGARRAGQCRDPADQLLADLGVGA